MASSDQTQMAVLGALSILPMTGYALREQIRDTLGLFWGESFGQIYPALAELERQELVERAESTGRSSVFAITPAGAQRLQALLAEPPVQSKPRNGLMLRLFFGRQLGPDACRQLVQDARSAAESQLAQLQQAREELQHDTSLDSDARYILLTISAGEHGARATVAWADQALAELDDISAAGGGNENE